MSSAPYQASAQTLGRASLAALVAGGIVLTLFVLPAEYGIDPTGVGKALGLTRMAGGDDAETAAEARVPDSVENTAVAPVPVQSKANIAKATTFRSDEKTITLAPHAGMEIKSRMSTGDSFVFRWTSSAPVRMDMHGEPKGATEGQFTSYWKQKDLTSAQGSFTAPFDGTHGWYWRNRGETPVTLTVKTEGFYGELFEPA
ncbi:hypothetical protein [Glacieibacterium sp.]|uniref:hypothetical protein n=1 Tax=Glacieibacterium sp. TaxID=2860237 RepID=UPI003AFFF2B4